MNSHAMAGNYFNNPIKLLHHLKNAGFTEKQAEAQVEMMSDYVEHGVATKKDFKNLELATKRDFKELELATKRDLKETETSIRKDFELKMKDLEFRLTVKTAGVVGSIVGIFSILEKIIK